MATLAAASWASSLTYSSLPPEVVQAAVRSFYNWIGCAVGGSEHPTTKIAHDTFSPFFGKETSSLLGRSLKTDAQHAALLNGIASHVHDYDDTHLETIVHPTGVVASTLLAFAQSLDKPISGKDFLTALVAGIEIECKLALAVWPDHYDIGWHITSTTGSIGAAVALSRLLRLSPEKTAHAIGIAATQVTGLREMFGSDTKSFHVGRAAQNGLMAAVLASGGYTSSPQALEAKRGWANCVSTTERLHTMTQDLGVTRPWEIEKNSFKPFACGIVVHPIITGAIDLHHDLKKLDIAMSKVKAVHTKVHPLVLELTGKTSPKDGLEAKFSVYHGAAVGLLFGKASLAEYDDALVTSPEVGSLRNRITAAIDENLRADECHISVELSVEPKKIERHVDHALGSVEVPMSTEQLSEKFMQQVSARVGDGRAQQASAWCWMIEQSDDIRQIGDVL